MAPAGLFRSTSIGLALLLAVSLAPGQAAAPASAGEAKPEGEHLPRLDKTGVLVPWEDFKKILEEIRDLRVTPPPPPPPVDFALSACKAAVTVNAGASRALVRLEFAVEVLARDTWAEIPVIAEGVALSRFDIDGRPANVYRKGGHHRIAVRGEGRHALVLEYLAQVTDSRGVNSTHLRFPLAPVIDLDLVVPRPRIDFDLPGAVVRSVESAPRQTRVRAAFQGAAEARVNWFKQLELGEKETKVFGETRTLLSIGEGMVRGTSNADLTIHGRGVDKVRLALPDGLNILDVGAQGMRDWAVENGQTPGDGRVLVVHLNYLAQGRYGVQVSFEQEIDGAPAAGGVPEGSEEPAEGSGDDAAAAGGDASAVIAVPDLELLDVIRDKGFIAVAASSSIEISPAGELKNATPVDPAELPPDIAAVAGQPVLFGFKYLRHPVAIGLQVVRHEDLVVKRTVVESARLFTYVSPDGPLITSARYTVKNNRKQYLELALPAGAEPWGAYLEDRPVKAARNAAGRILVPLRKTAADAAGHLPSFGVELVYFERRTNGLWGRRQFRAPSLDVDAMEVQWHLFLPRDHRYGWFDGNLRPDDQLNRVVYLGRGAYNLGSRRDLARLSAVMDDRYVGDKTESEESGRLELDEAKDAEVQGGRANEKRDRLESELRQVAGEDRGSDSPAPAPRLEGAQSGFAPTVTQAWGAGERGAAGAGALARGVLPVRFRIPADGLRLSFSGRLVTASEEATVSMRSWPLGWTLSSPVVFLLSLLLTLGILRLRSGAPAPAERRRLGVALVAAAALLLLFVLCPGARTAFWLGMALAVAGFFAYQVVVTPRAVQALALLLAGAVALAATAPAAFAAQPRRPGLPDLQDTEITLSWKDFKALVEKTFVPPVVDPPPPTEAFLRSAEYTGRLEPGVLTLDGTIALEVLKQGWTRLPLTSDGAVLSFEGGGALLNRTDGRVEVLARGPASYTLRAKFLFPATGNPGENRLAVNLPDAARNLLNLAAASGFRDLEVESGLAYAKRQGRVFVALPRGGLRMKYTLPFRRTEDQGGEEVKLEPRVQVEGYQLLQLGEGVVSGVLIHDYTVRVARVDHFDIDLPEGLVVFDAAAPGLESWKILEREGRRFLRVKLLAPADGRVRVSVSFEGAYDAETGTMSVPRFAPLAVERESGFIAVAAEGAEVDLALTGRLLPADVSEMPADVLPYGGNLIAACKYSGPPDAASVTIVEHEDAPVLTAIIESLNATAALLENGTEATWVDLSIKNNRKQFLNLTLPGADVEIWSLLLDGEPAKPKRTGDTVLIPLPRGDRERAARVSLVLLRKAPPVRAFRRIEPRLPRFDIPVSEALWTVYLPEGMRYVVSHGAFRPVIVTAPLFRRTSRQAGLGGLPTAGGPATAFRQAAPAAMPADEAEPSRVMKQAAEQPREELMDAVSESTARAQITQEGLVARQLRQKKGVRKGTLPVQIAIPGGVGRLPRVTVSRMLIVGDEDNVFSLRPYPAWIGGVLRVLQPLLLLGAGILSGLALAGILPRRYLQRGALPAAVLGLMPWGDLPVMAALFVLLATAGVTWATPLLYRRLRPGTA